MGLLQKDEADNFLGVSGFFDDAWNDLKSSASDTITKITESGKKAIGLDTGKSGGGTDTVVTPTQTQTTEAPKKSNTVLYVGIGAGVLLVGWLLLRKPKKKGK